MRKWKQDSIREFGRSGQKGRAGSRVTGFWSVAVFLATTSASASVAVPDEARARELSIGGFEFGGDRLAYPSPHNLHCDGIDGSTTTVDDSEQWYCYDEGVAGNRDLAQIGWSDTDRVLGDSVDDQFGSAEVHLIGAKGDEDWKAIIHTLIEQPYDWGEGSCPTCTLAEGHVLLVDGWVRSEGLLGNVEVGAVACPPDTDPAVFQVCPGSSFETVENRILDGYRDGIPGISWNPVTLSAISPSDVEVLHVQFQTRTRWNDLGLSPVWFLDDVSVREYPTSGPESLKFRPWYSHREYVEREDVTDEIRFDREPVAFVDTDWSTQVAIGADHFAHDAAGAYNGPVEDYCGALLVSLPPDVQLERADRSGNAVLVSETLAETWLLQYASSFDAGAGTVACHTSTGLSLPGPNLDPPWQNDRFENLRLRATAPCLDGECGDILVIPYWFDDGDDLALFTAEDFLATSFSGVGPAEEDLVIHLRQVSTPGVSVRPTRLQGDLAGSDSTSAQRRWPGFRELAVHVGADGVTLANAELYSYDSGFGPENVSTSAVSHGCPASYDCSLECATDCVAGTAEC